MQLAHELHDGVASILVDETGHSCVLQILKLVAQVDGVNHLRVFDCDRLLILDFSLEEITEVCLLRHAATILVSLLKVVIVSIAARITIG